MELFDLTVEFEKEPMGVETSGLRFGWKARGEEKQKNWRIVIAQESGTTVYDSGTQDGERSENIAPTGIALATRTPYVWTLTVTAENGDTATAQSRFATGIAPEEWYGAWIRPKRYVTEWAPYLRTRFTVDKPLRRATLYACGLGVSEIAINGKIITDALLDAPMTNYEKEVLYRVYDVKSYLTDKNGIAFLLGGGFYDQRRIWGVDGGFSYGPVCLRAQLELEFEDGTKTVIVSHKGWRARYSPICSNNIYAGETYDARLAFDDASAYDYDRTFWEEVEETDAVKGTLKAALMPPVREIRRLPALKVEPVSGKQDGCFIYDLGENFAGTVCYHLPRSPRGQIVTFRYAEALTKEGALDVRSSGSFATMVVQEDRYICNGNPNGEVFQPRFTYHGFRYVEVTGYFSTRKYGDVPDAAWMEGIALSTDLRKTGSFTCANADLNHLQGIMMNTFRSNYHGFPEDCPAREKCGWLGDAEVVSDTACMNYDMASSYEKYLRDIRTTKDVYGTWMMISPGKRGCGGATPLWGCAQVILPYKLWLYYGDENAVRENWDYMEQWIAHECEIAKDGVIEEGLGDWCPPQGNSEGKRRIPVAHSSTLMLIETCEKMAVMAERLGLGDPAKYNKIVADTKEAFNRHYYDSKKHTYGYQASDAAALSLRVVPESDFNDVAKSLLSQIRDTDKWAMTTGIYGNKMLLPALADLGCGADALKIMFNRDAVSFGTMMDAGATSLWESLEMPLPAPREVTLGSYNHPMHSGFAYFLYSHIGGIRPLTPGFRSFLVHPVMVKEIPSADVSYDTPYGIVRVAYETAQDGNVTYTVTVPANTEAVLDLPGTERRNATEGVTTVTAKI